MKQRDQHIPEAAGVNVWHNVSATRHGTNSDLRSGQLAVTNLRWFGVTPQLAPDVEYTSFAGVKGGSVTSAGWQVTLCE